MAVCDRCGERNHTDARFCSACGAALPESRHAGLEVRKTVTILFCDTVGSTALGEATDPETTRRVMTRYAETMAEIVRRHGGTVERFRGDEVMAVFGVPVIHEDDALRAVRAGREMQGSLARLNDELRERWGVELACRIGINTGEVVAGDPSTRETFVTGDAVNLAKRLEQAAEPGSILIGTATYPLVKDAVTVGPRERFRAKGKSGDVDRMRLDEVDTSAAGYARRLDAPLVGRVADMARIVSEIDRLIAEGRCGLVSVVGSAGVGKSRLTREIAERYERSSRVVSGRCLSYGSGITYWPLVELVQALGGLDEVARLVEALDDGALALEQLRAAIGESDRAVPGDELFWGVRRVLEGIARDRPLLVCLDDLHWAEPMMLDLLEYLVAFATGPLVLLCNARPDLLETRPSWGDYLSIELGHLSESETDELVTALGIDDDEIRRSITATAEGNPLFAEQLAAMVMESGTLPGKELELPASIHALLAARLDSLQTDERRALERASVIGKEFWQRAIADLSSVGDRPRVAGSLLSLARKGLIRPVRAAAPTQDTFHFRHALIRDVTYAGLPKAVRAELHEAFATWLRSQPPGVGEHDEIIGYHFEQAHMYLSALAPSDERTHALAGVAADLLGDSGKRAFARDDMVAAANLLGRAAMLLHPGHPRLLEVLSDRAIALWEAGRAEEVEDALERLATEARAAGVESVVALAELERVAHEQLAGGDLEAVQVAANRVIELSAAARDGVGQARAWRRLCAAHRRAGSYRSAEEAARKALEHARAAGDLREEARAVDALCNCLLYGPTHVREALEVCARLLDGAQTTSLTLEANVTGVVAGLRAMDGDFEAARSAYGRAAASLEGLGLELARAALTQVGVPLELLAGDPRAAEREARLGQEILTRFGSAEVQAPLIAEALLAQGRGDEADAAVGGLMPGSGPAIVYWQVRLSIVRTRLAVLSGLADDALAIAAEGTRLASETDDLTLRGDTFIAHADALRAAGRMAESEAQTAAALASYVAKGNRAAVALLRGSRGAASRVSP